MSSLYLIVIVFVVKLIFVLPLALLIFVISFEGLPLLLCFERLFWILIVSRAICSILGPPLLFESCCPLSFHLRVHISSLRLGQQFVLRGAWNQAYLREGQRIDRLLVAVHENWLCCNVNRFLLGRLSLQISLAQDLPTLDQSWLNLRRLSHQEHLGDLIDIVWYTVIFIKEQNAAAFCVGSRVVNALHVLDTQICLEVGL